MYTICHLNWWLRCSLMWMRICLCLKESKTRSRQLWKGRALMVLIRHPLRLRTEETQLNPQPHSPSQVLICLTEELAQPQHLVMNQQTTLNILSAIFVGNHGTFGPVFSSTSDLMLEPGRKEKCPLTRCLSAREARMVKRSKSTRALEVTHFARPSEQHGI